MKFPKTPKWYKDAAKAEENIGDVTAMSPENYHTAKNEDVELWREADDYYANSIHRTKTGGIGINVGGTVYVKTLEQWHGLAGGRYPGIRYEDEMKALRAENEALKQLTRDGVSIVNLIEYRAQSQRYFEIAVSYRKMLDIAETALKYAHAAIPRHRDNTAMAAIDQEPIEEALEQMRTLDPTKPDYVILSRNDVLHVFDALGVAGAQKSTSKEGKKILAQVGEMLNIKLYGDKKGTVK